MTDKSADDGDMNERNFVGSMSVKCEWSEGKQKIQRKYERKYDSAIKLQKKHHFYIFSVCLCNSLVNVVVISHLSTYVQLHSGGDPA